MKKKLFLGILGCLFFSVAQAQIGYQVALLNSATGKPRANETVSANVVITDSNNGTVCSETKTVTSNDFGILSFAVGDADTFKDVTIGRLPLFISVSVDGVLIGKSQILSVPVAEVAKRLVSIDKSLIVGTWSYPKFDGGKVYYTFYDNGKWSYKAENKNSDTNEWDVESHEGTYEIEGRIIYCGWYPAGGGVGISTFYYSNGWLWSWVTNGAVFTNFTK